MNAYLLLAGRIGLSLIFIISGWGKIAGYAVTQSYMDAMGVPGVLLPLVIALELGGGLAILGGIATRWFAIGLAVFSVASAVLFHANFADQMQAMSFWKNIAIAGGFLLLAASGPGALSIESRLPRTPPATR
ncbi:DoxX family protein [Lysobacteraceae bacterium NML93-0792]|nr:DoxX family protein [Xanthomonadaceae bacterium NML93-0792]PBS16572.1 DoxX family protein [Xanthomonadaceae bacterium NML93-0793]PBS19947.1 DoxX family protein [Xanthomonadaceae bacterium NML93-0831]